MSEKMREEFEAAYERQYGAKPRGWDDRLHAYRDAHSNGGWWAWRTATPRAFGDGWASGYSAGFRAAGGEIGQ